MYTVSGPERVGRARTMRPAAATARARRTLGTAEHGQAKRTDYVSEASRWRAELGVFVGGNDRSCYHHGVAQVSAEVEPADGQHSPLHESQPVRRPSNLSTEVTAGGGAAGRWVVARSSSSGGSLVPTTLRKLPLPCAGPSRRTFAPDLRTFVALYPDGARAMLPHVGPEAHGTGQGVERQCRGGLQ